MTLHLPWIHGTVGGGRPCMKSELSSDEIRKILQDTKRIAVVGLSPVPNRPSHGVTRYMIGQGYEIFGVRPGSPAEVLGRPNVEKVSDLPGGIDLIDVFRNADAIPGLVDEIAAWMKTLPADQRPKALWLQEGITHPEAEEKARQLGLAVVSDRCILKEHSRLM